MPRIDDLITAAADAQADVFAAQARLARLKAAATAEAERIREAVGSVNVFQSGQGLGSLRLDNAAKPAQPVITDRSEVGSWLAERAPGETLATITVPAGRLAEALDALEFAGLDGSDVAADVVPGPDVDAWIAEHCRLIVDPDTPAGTAPKWNLLYVDADGHTEVVPGVNGVRPNPYWTLTLTPAVKASRVELAAKEAQVELDSLLDEPEGDPADVPPVEVDPPAAPGFTESTPKETLVDACKERGLPISGSKAALLARLGEKVPA